MTGYDNKNKCVKCSCENEIKITDTINMHIAECRTKCSKCGFEDYWAHGFFESKTDEQQEVVK